MKRHQVILSAGVGLGLLLLFLFLGPEMRSVRDGGWGPGIFRKWAQGPGQGPGPGDPILKIPGPSPDPLAGLPPSPLNAFLQPGLTPRQQTDIVGQLLLDYWNNLHTLPSGTWEETRAALAGANAKRLVFVEPGHPAIARDAFRAAADASGIHIHVISASGGSFQLIYDGPDRQPFTEDDLIRNFPDDLEF
ncbi:MAG: hypothetical protein KGS60_02945 [Verrucomicrobia bacterium]|nr:hypothetical protein [Verrucomicrobiota bacterium]